MFVLLGALLSVHNANILSREHRNEVRSAPSRFAISLKKEFVCNDIFFCFLFLFFVILLFIFYSLFVFVGAVWL